MFRSARVAPILAVMLAATLSACGADSETTKPASQVAVKVNKDEVTVHQLNEVLSRAGNLPADQVKQASGAALERLIDQELMVQQAQDRKLDRDPKVMQSLEFARREILARAYAEQVVGAASRPTDAQISAFYDDNPGLFSKRRIYNLQELNIKLAPERIDEMRAQLQAAGTAQQFAAWLTDQNIPFTANAGNKPAEQLPLEVLKGLHQLNPGQVAVSRTPTGVLLLFVAGVRDEPIDQTKARPFIEQYLLNQTRTELAKSEVKRLRELATIEYVGDFAPPAPADTSTSQVKAPASSPVTPATAPVTPAAAPPANADTDAAARAILEKGAAGLK